MIERKTRIWWMVASSFGLLTLIGGVALGMIGIELPAAFGPGAIVFLGIAIKNQADLVMERKLSEKWQDIVREMQPLATRRSGDEERADVMMLLTELKADAETFTVAETRDSTIVVLSRIAQIIGSNRHEGLARSVVRGKRSGLTL